MKTLTYILSLAVLVLFMPACEEEKNPNEMIAGDNHKTWHPAKETDASGDKEKLSDEEKDESWVFYSNGTMSMNLASQSVKGDWRYDAAAKELVVTPEGGPAMSFAVEELSDDKMKLKAGDGSEMKLKAED